jgi:hypothetical protein
MPVYIPFLKTTISISHFVFTMSHNTLVGQILGRARDDAAFSLPIQWKPCSTLNHPEILPHQP